MKKLLYILPEYRKDAHTHFSYIPAFLREAATHLSITLIVERGDIPSIAGLQSGRAGFFAIVLARLRGCRTCYIHYSFKGAFLAALVFRISGGTVLYWNCGLPWQYRRSYAREFFERLVYRMVSYVVTGTEDLAMQYATQYAIPRTKILVMSNWIDVETTKREGGEMREEVRVKLGIGPEQKMVLFVHRLSERKGAHYLPGIASAMPEKAVLVVIGDGPLRSSLEHRANGGALKGKMQFLGWMPHRDVLAYMHAADVYILPSDEEGFPHTLLEAMALGTPFVAIAVGGVPEIVWPSAKSLLIPVGDMALFVKRLTEMLALPADVHNRETFEAHAWVGRYDTRVVLKQFVKMVTDL